MNISFFIKFYYKWITTGFYTSSMHISINIVSLYNYSKNWFWKCMPCHTMKIHSKPSSFESEILFVRNLSYFIGWKRPIAEVAELTDVLFVQQRWQFSPSNCRMSTCSSAIKRTPLAFIQKSIQNLLNKSLKNSNFCSKMNVVRRNEKPAAAASIPAPILSILGGAIPARRKRRTLGE